MYTELGLLFKHRLFEERRVCRAALEHSGHTLSTSSVPVATCLTLSPTYALKSISGLCVIFDLLLNGCSLTAVKVHNSKHITYKVTSGEAGFMIDIMFFNLIILKGRPDAMQPVKAASLLTLPGNIILC